MTERTIIQSFIRLYYYSMQLFLIATVVTVLYIRNEVSCVPSKPLNPFLLPFLLLFDPLSFSFPSLKVYWSITDGCPEKICQLTKRIVHLMLLHHPLSEPLHCMLWLLLHGVRHRWSVLRWESLVRVNHTHAPHTPTHHHHTSTHVLLLRLKSLL